MDRNKEKENGEMRKIKIAENWKENKLENTKKTRNEIIKEHSKQTEK